MLRVLSASRPEGAAALASLSASRSRPDFDTLLAALPIVREVLEKGVPAVLRFVKQLDGAALDEPGLFFDPREAPTGDVDVDPTFAAAFRIAEKRIRAYHRRQRVSGAAWRDAEGVSFTERPLPHDAVGVYVPGGAAFYPSSLLMGVVPARIARTRRVVVATPPRAWRGSRELRWAVRKLGVERVLLAGGAHGIAALHRVAGCTKIVGPGNAWVAAAKHLLSSVVSVDLPAGPSEVLILASSDAPADRIAADLLAQAEHDPRAVCLLFTTSAALARKVTAELSRQLPALATAETARRSLSANGLALVFRGMDAAARAAVAVAAEHVQLMGREAERRGGQLMETAGAVFTGADTPTALGDYIAGPNHVLPTGGAARSFSGLSLREFYRWGRSVRAGPRAAARLSRPAATLARFEGLDAHARSLLMRAG